MMILKRNMIGDHIQCKNIPLLYLDDLFRQSILISQQRIWTSPFISLVALVVSLSGSLSVLDFKGVPKLVPTNEFPYQEVSG
jgi:hypothetical protein